MIQANFITYHSQNGPWLFKYTYQAFNRKIGSTIISNQLLDTIIESTGFCVFTNFHNTCNSFLTVSVAGNNLLNL